MFDSMADYIVRSWNLITQLIILVKFCVYYRILTNRYENKTNNYKLFCVIL